MRRRNGQGAKRLQAIDHVFGDGLSKDCVPFILRPNAEGQHGNARAAEAGLSALGTHRSMIAYALFGGRLAKIQSFDLAMRDRARTDVRAVCGYCGLEQAVTAFRHGLDIAGSLGVITEGLAKRRNGTVHGIVADEDATPDHVQHLFWRNCPGRFANQEQKHVHDARLYGLSAVLRDDGERIWFDPNVTKRERAGHPVWPEPDKGIDL